MQDKKYSLCESRVGKLFKKSKRFLCAALRKPLHALRSNFFFDRKEREVFRKAREERNFFYS